jgi:glycosyltransferase involved in cell wall biosynthesis
MPTLDIVIPVKDRPLAACVESLQASLGEWGDCTYRILICDGGSTQPEVVATLAALATEDTIDILPRPRPGFNKAVLLNQGLRQTHADLVLISDADILWNATTLAALCHTLGSQPLALCHIAHVAETAPQTAALSRQRYRYSLKKSGSDYTLTLQTAPPNPHQRPGCGLVCAYRNTWFQLGGYKECFQGWGWEDQDLLIRAGLIDRPILAVGSVLHQSHPDEVRNQFHGGLAPFITRDRNLRTCLQSLQTGDLSGDLSNPAPSGPNRSPQQPSKIKVEIVN